MVEYSFDYDDLRFEREERSFFDERERMRERDLLDEIRRERELDRRDREDDMRRAAMEAARLEETKVESLQTADLVEAINNPLVQVMPDGKISSRPLRRTMRAPSGRDIIRRSGQFSAAALMPRPKKPRKKNKKHCKNLSECFEQANAELRKMNGQLRKGKTQSDIATRAHRLMKKKE